MTTPSSRILLVLIILLTVICGADFSKSRAAEATGPVILEKVETDLITPDVIGRSHGGGYGRDGKWELIEFAFSVEAPDKGTSDKEVKYLDEVQFKAFIEARNGTGNKAETIVLTGEVTYICVPVARGIYGSLYIPADVVNRYGLNQGASRYQVTVQAFVGGQMVDFKHKISSEKEAEWFAAYKSATIQGLVFNKTQSPFILSDQDRYPTIKPK